LAGAFEEIVETQTASSKGDSARGPFAGLIVVEFGRFIAAPYCGQLLADGGADVIKVEPLQGDESRLNSPLMPGEGRQFLNKNRGKRSIAVNLSDPRALAAMKRLAARADVVIANFRPGLARRLGLDYETLSALNSRLIYAENTAFGDDGPLAGAPGMNTILECYAGMAQLTEDGPRSHGEPFVDYGAALLLAWGVAGALYHRERTGRGQRVTTSLLQSALTLQNNTVNEVDRFDAPRRAAAEQLKADLAGGVSWADALARREAGGARLAAAYHGVHQTADGFITIACPGRANQRKLLDLLHLEDRWVTEPGWQPDDPTEHAARTRAHVDSRFREQPTGYWLDALAEVGLPVGRVQLKEDVLQDRHIWENGFLVRLEHERLGGMTVVAPPVRFSETPLAARSAPPVLGRHTREVLREAGLDDGEIEQLVADGAVREPEHPA
jgi:formyl-CoA transferase